MPGERRFRDDGTKATRFYEPDDGDDRMTRMSCMPASYQNLKKSRNSDRFCNSPPTGYAANLCYDPFRSKILCTALMDLYAIV
jgi:hypothetical protein